MKINERTERNDWPTKRQRCAYDAGYRAGKREAEEQTEALQARNEHWKTKGVEQQLDYARRGNATLGSQLAESRRELAFANDRIQQLIHNSSSIPKDDT